MEYNQQKSDFIGRAEIFSICSYHLEENIGIVLKGLPGAGISALGKKLALKFVGGDSNRYFIQKSKYRSEDDIFNSFDNFFNKNFNDDSLNKMLAYWKSPQTEGFKRPTSRRNKPYYPTGAEKTKAITGHIIGLLRKYGIVICYDDFHNASDTSPLRDLLNTFVMYEGGNPQKAKFRFIIVGRRKVQDFDLPQCDVPMLPKNALGQIVAQQVSWDDRWNDEVYRKFGRHIHLWKILAWQLRSKREVPENITDILNDPLIKQEAKKCWKEVWKFINNEEQQTLHKLAQHPEKYRVSAKLLNELLEKGLIIAQEVEDSTHYLPCEAFHQIIAHSNSANVFPPNATEHKPMPKYDKQKIQELLEGFDIQALRSFCLTTPEFEAVYGKLGRETGKDVVKRIITHADNTYAFETLLEWAKEKNPRRYNKVYASYIIGAGAETTPSEEKPSSSSKPSPTPSPAAKKTPTFKLQLTRLDEQNFTVRVIEGPRGGGEPIESKLPYSPAGLTAILKALYYPKYDPKKFTDSERKTLTELKLLYKTHFSSERYKQIGKTLYRALMPGEAHTALQVALNSDDAVSLELRFDPNAVELAQYPWELICDKNGQFLLLRSRVQLTRYISYNEKLPEFNVAHPWRLLYIKSRPTNLKPLDSQEESKIRQALTRLEKEKSIILEDLPNATYASLLDRLEEKEKPIHILHFDGHGVFARRCPHCEVMNYPHHSECQNEDCQGSLEGIEAYGFLAFEKKDTQSVTWIKSEKFGSLLSQQKIRLTVLSACRSGSVGGKELFNGTSPSLIQAGVPAVLSTQLPISVEGAGEFMYGFYKNLFFETLPEAVNDGRLRLQNEEWFIPTLYLRSK
ncbi:MAG: hypothetical protein B6243_05695 [Anaerolineaceae bacterium 4572_5.2]|nr:MAG: hypothetical protein B6243_05695 [Anaerolineaceae bacterium 4572_5.2]